MVAPVFGSGARRYDLSAEEGAATHRIDVTSVAARKIAALACHASQPDAEQEAAEQQATLDRDGVLYEGFTRVRPIVPPRIRDSTPASSERSPAAGRRSHESLVFWSGMTIDSNLAKVDEVMTALYEIHDPEIGMSIVDLDLIKHVEIGSDGAPSEIKMVLTTPFCPWAGELIQTVKEKAEEVVGPPVKVTLLADRWEPPPGLF